MVEPHTKVLGGNYGVRVTAQKILRTKLWWPTLHNETTHYAWNYDICQRVGKPSRHVEMLLVP